MSPVAARALALVVGAGWVAAGIAIFAWPMLFYMHVPGVLDWGPFNGHFIRDVALAFVACGAAAIYGACKRRPALLVAAAAWPTLHALMHLLMWLHRGLPVDVKASFDGVFVVAPALAMLWAARRMSAARLTNPNP